MRQQFIRLYEWSFRRTSSAKNVVKQPNKISKNKNKFRKKTTEAAKTIDFFKVAVVCSIVLGGWVGCEFVCLFIFIEWSWREWVREYTCWPTTLIRFVWLLVHNTFWFSIFFFSQGRVFKIALTLVIGRLWCSAQKWKENMKWKKSILLSHLILLNGAVLGLRICK